MTAAMLAQVGLVSGMESAEALGSFTNNLVNKLLREFVTIMSWVKIFLSARMVSACEVLVAAINSEEEARLLVMLLMWLSTLDATVSAMTSATELVTLSSSKKAVVRMAFLALFSRQVLLVIRATVISTQMSFMQS